ncbi:lipoprotein, putative [Pseudooceanicola batsensis HTCC2597]|uniref:Lipoprotein, putative n=1 Tax=Pseudooceanicola batsensis (strain ATCC BAA-863 / DSM 15984 / KCTC 12145 / HTCC2597) TaxID=252305 RepID=A3TVA0_PSEBH|nr:hypothetical protein [Pseudooceanicola batsensis]EAQ04446.1 lipoprotein, putative [Pseudooceanicola batsensis HTCC2597]
MKRLFLALAAIAVLAGCTRNPEVQPPQELANVAYRNTGPTSLTLYTVINKRSGAGGHTALEVDGSESVLFDPAGSFKAQGVVRSGDVLYGFSPSVEEAYQSQHARSAFYVTKLTVPVTPEVAELALQRVKANGPVGAAHCAQSTSTILKGLPGFESIRQTFYPRKLESQFSAIPGARSETIEEND